jgi:Zn-dependent peptidase ImmA (M78 family)
MPIKAPFLPAKRIRQIADEFLAKYHPSRAIPVPIEEIVEFSLDIDIVPIPGLHQSFAIDSMISSDFRCISIDEHVLTSRPGRYRFSLAHEVGHREMHADTFKELKCESITEWKAMITDMIPQREYDFLELHAYSFAGLVLVPPQRLEEAFDKVIRLVQENGIPLYKDSEHARLVIADHLAKEFVVSREVIERRLRNDELWDKAFS